MHEIFRSLLSCRTNRAVENALSLSREPLSAYPFILPWHESVFSACIANLHMNWLQPCGISGRHVFGYFFRTRIFQFFLRFQKCAYAKTQCRHRIRAKSFLFLSVHTKTLTIRRYASKNLYYRDRFQKSAFLVLEITVYVWTEETEKKNLPFQKYPGAILIKLQKHANRPNSSIASSKNSER